MKVRSYSAAAPQEPVAAEEVFLVGVVNSGKLENLRLLLRMPNIREDAQGAKGVAAFMHAASLGRVDMMELLSPKYGLKLNERNAAGETALLQAARNNRVDAMRWLMEANADVNIMDNAGSTAFLTYINSLAPSAEPSKELVKLFIDAHLDFDATDADGNTALMLLAKMPGPAKDILLDQMKGRSSINAVDRNGYTALHRAAEWRYYDFGVRLVGAGASARIHANDGRTAQDVVKDAARIALDYDFVVYLDHIEKQESLEARLAARAGLKQQAALWHAAHKQPADESDARSGRIHFNEVRTEAAFSPAAHELDFSELGYARTPLFKALQSGVWEDIRLVLKESSVNINVRDANGWSPVMHAAFARDRNFLKLFLGELDSNQMKFDLKLLNDFNESVLIVAARRGIKENMKILLERGADVKFVDKLGRNVLMAYLQTRAEEARTSPGADAQANGKAMSAEVDADVVRLLLDEKVNPGSVDNSRKTAAMYFAGTVGTKAKQMFLREEGVPATLDMIDAFGRTALMHAMQQRDLEYFKLLLDAGADVNLQVNGYSAKSLATRPDLQEFSKIIESAERVKDGSPTVGDVAQMSDGN